MSEGRSTAERTEAAETRDDPSAKGAREQPKMPEERKVVRAYARDPSERNALMVEATIEALRRQRTGSRS